MANFLLVNPKKHRKIGIVFSLFFGMDVLYSLFFAIEAMKSLFLAIEASRSLYFFNRGIAFSPFLQLMHCIFSLFRSRGIRSSPIFAIEALQSFHFLQNKEALHSLYFCDGDILLKIPRFR